MQFISSSQILCGALIIIFVYRHLKKCLLMRTQLTRDAFVFALPSELHIAVIFCSVLLYIIYICVISLDKSV